MRAIEAAAREVLYTDNERVHAFTHLSHVYRQGCSIYSTFVFRSAGDPDEDMARWRRLKSCVSMEIIENVGTISHQHGVGVDHAPYLVHEKGELGLDMMRSLARAFDPQQTRNKGNVFA